MRNIRQFVFKHHSSLKHRINNSRQHIVQKIKYPKTLLAATGLLGFYYWDTEFNAKALQRNFRTLWNGILITWDYKVNFTPAADIDAIHQRTADRILYTCQKNGGLYIKFGQGIYPSSHL
jgi:hypothetical protein